MCSGIVTHPALELCVASLSLFPSKTFQIQKDTSENGESLTLSLSQLASMPRARGAPTYPTVFGSNPILLFNRVEPTTETF